jgi:hypothetical protein
MNMIKQHVSLITSALALLLIAAGCSQPPVEPMPSNAGSSSVPVFGKVHVAPAVQVNTTSSPPDVFSTSTEAYFLSGPIAKKDDSSVTVTLRDGTSKDVLMDDSTIIEKFNAQTQKMEKMTAADLKIGDLVLINVTTTSNGIIKATTIREGVMMPN